MPSFCSECGERLKPRGARLWPRRARCYHCDRGFRSELPPLAALIVLLLGAGFVIGRYTRRPEPFYFIGTPVDRGSLPLVSSAEKGNQQGAAAADPRKKAGETLDSICGAPTRSGKPCQRKVRGGGFCWQHRGTQKR